jgi:hypothetical protein
LLIKKEQPPSNGENWGRLLLFFFAVVVIVFTPFMAQSNNCGDERTDEHACIYQQGRNLIEFIIPVWNHIVDKKNI